MKAEVFFYSPFSPSNVSEETNKVFLLQFILSEIIHCWTAIKKSEPLFAIFQTSRGFFPYDWSHSTGHLNKAQEHASLLKYAFPDQRETGQAFLTLLMETIHWVSLHCHEDSSNHPELIVLIRKLYLHLEPLLKECSSSENLIFFLLKHQTALIDICPTFTSFLIGLYPEGLSRLKDSLCDHYHRRGFASVIPELKLLIDNLEKSYVNI